MKLSPSKSMKDRFESKEKLVAAVQALATSELWLDRVNSVKGLSRVSNAKLLRLHRLLSDAKQRFGTRDKLISNIAEFVGPKDADYRRRLQRYPLPRLLDLHASLARRHKASAAPASK